MSFRARHADEESWGVFRSPGWIPWTSVERDPGIGHRQAAMLVMTRSAETCRKRCPRLAW